MGNKTEFKPGDELSGDNWVYSQNGNYRMGVRDNKAVVEKVNPDGKNEIVNTLGESKQKDGTNKLVFEDENFLHSGERRLELKNEGPPRGMGGGRGTTTEWTGGRKTAKVIGMMTTI